MPYVVCINGYVQFVDMVTQWYTMNDWLISLWQRKEQQQVERKSRSIAAWDIDKQTDKNFVDG